MPTGITHAFVGLAGAKILARQKRRAKFWVLAPVCAFLPDLDTIGFRFGVKYWDMLGHRGLTHSVPFALVLSLAVVLLFFREHKPFASRQWWWLWLFFFLVTVSQGILDAMTDGGLGVAFFAPFSNERFFLPWRPIRVAPIGIGGFLRNPHWASRCLVSEFTVVWLPMILLMIVTHVRRKRTASSSPTSSRGETNAS
jgi:inner membrane protein